MSFLGSLVGAGVGELADGVASAVDRFVETEEERKAADILLLKAQQNPDRWQAEINKIEAAHRNVFISGWRPAMGWMCSIGLAWSYVIRPAAEMVLVAMDMRVALPNLETGELLTLVFALLGLAGTRTYEKKNGLTR